MGNGVEVSLIRRRSRAGPVQLHALFLACFSAAVRELRDDCIGVIDASAPHASARLHQRGPKPRVVGQTGCGADRGRGRVRKPPRAFFGEKRFLVLRPPGPPSRAARCGRLTISISRRRARGQWARRQAPPAKCGRCSSGRDSAEPRIREHRHVLAKRRLFSAEVTW